MSEPTPGPDHFPSIEDAYGRSVEDWEQLIRSSPLTDHDDLVAWLRDEHAMAHDHAHALVTRTLAQDRSAGSDPA